MSSKEPPLLEHTPAEFAFLLTISGHIRFASSVLILLFLLALLVLFVHKPAVTTNDIVHSAYSTRVANELAAKHAELIGSTFRKNRAYFDDPYLAIVDRYLRAKSDTERGGALRMFLNTREVTRHENLLLLIEEPAIARSLKAYVSGIKYQGQTYFVPIIDVRTTRDTVALSFCILVALAHLYVVVKLTYLRNVRAVVRAKCLPPDPSLFSATAEDLSFFYGVRNPVRALQWTMTYLSSLIMGAIVLIYVLANRGLGSRDFALSHLGILFSLLGTLYPAYLAWRSRHSPTPRAASGEDHGEEAKATEPREAGARRRGRGRR